MAKPGSTQIGNQLVTTIPTLIKFGQKHPIQEAARFEIECIVPPIDDFATEILADIDVPNNCRVHVNDVTIKRCTAFTGVSGAAWTDGGGTTTVEIQSNDGHLSYLTIGETPIQAAPITDLTGTTQGEGMSYDGGGPVITVDSVTSTTAFYATNPSGLAVGDMVHLIGTSVTTGRTISTIGTDGLITLSGTHGMTVGSPSGSYWGFIFKRTTVAATANAATQTLTSIAGMEIGDVLYNATVGDADADAYGQISALNPSTRVVTFAAARDWTAADVLWLIKPFSHGGIPGKGLRAKVANVTSITAGTPLIINVRGWFIPNEWHLRAMSDYISAANAGGGGIWAAPA